MKCVPMRKILCCASVGKSVEDSDFIASYGGAVTRPAHSEMP